MGLRLWLVIVCGGVLLAEHMGIRQSLGIYFPAITSQTGWAMQSLATVFAVQNLVIGLAQPFASMIAERYGTARTLAVGGVLYAVGLAWMSAAGSTAEFELAGGLLAGIALSAMGFPVVLAATGRMAPPQWRSLALGLVSAGGSAGQFVFAPVSRLLIEGWGWQTALLVMAALCLAAAPLAIMLRGRPEPLSHGVADSLVDGAETMTAALARAGRSRDYWLLNLGFFVCGFHVSFIAAHLPTFASVCGLSYGIGANTLAIIGLFNIAGGLGAGVLGMRYRKGWLLSAIYGSRAVVILAFMILPKSDLSFLLFGGFMGLLWLSTVPLTSGLVGQLFGVRFMATLFGIVFLSHQVGAFLGAWMGGYVFEQTGSYDAVWYVGIALGALAAVIHLPIPEQPKGGRAAMVAAE